MSPLSLCHRVVGRGLQLLGLLLRIFFVPFLLPSPRHSMAESKTGGGNGAARRSHPFAGGVGVGGTGEEGNEQEEKEKDEEIAEEEDRWEVNSTGEEIQDADVSEEREEAENDDDDDDDDDDDADDDDEEEDEDDDEVGDYSAEFDPDRQGSRRPFTSLNQVDADLALARRLQEQERAYMLLTMGGMGGAVSDFVGSETGSEYELHYEDEEEDNSSEGRGTVEESDDNDEAFDARNRSVVINQTNANYDEAYARALQDAEEREVVVRLMALAGIRISEDIVEHRSSSQEAWLEVDPDELTYEELLALGEAVGTEGRGLNANEIASLPSVKYQSTGAEEESNDQCVICRLDFDHGEKLHVLPCKHLYHPECINQWLQINKICPICSAEVSITECVRK